MKILNIIKIIPLIFGISASSVYAAQISVDMISGGSVDSALSSNITSSFNIDIILNDVTDFAGFEFDLYFDSTIVKATAITSGYVFGLDTFPLENVINASSIGFSETTFALTGLDILSPTILATISFDVVGSGTDVFSLSNVILSDSFGVEIAPANLNSGNLTVPSDQSSNVPEPSILMLVIIGLFFFGWHQRTKFSFADNHGRGT